METRVKSPSLLYNLAWSKMAPKLTVANCLMNLSILREKFCQKMYKKNHQRIPPNFRGAYNLLNRFKFQNKCLQQMLWAVMVFGINSPVKWN